MADLFTRVWPVFLQEVDQQLSAMEQLLSQENADVAALFRHYHTLKGSFTAANFEQLASLAHNCEDILSQYRQQQSVLSEAALDLLRESLFFYRTALRKLEQSQQEPEVDAQLLSRIQQHNHSGIEENKRSNDYQQFVDSARLALPSIALGLRPEAKQQNLLPLLQPFLLQAEAHGFAALASSIKSLIGYIQQPDNTNYQYIELAAACFELCHRIAEQYDLVLSLDNAISLLKPLLQQRWLETLASLHESLQGEQFNLVVVLESLKLADQLLALLGGFAIQKIFRYISYMLQQSKVANSQVVACLIACLESIKNSDDLRQAALIQQLNEHSNELQASIKSQSSDTNQQLRQQLLAEQQLSSCALQGLSQRQWQSLQRAVDSAHHVYEVHIDFLDQQLSEKILQTLQLHAEIVHSWTVFYQQQPDIEATSVCFLCISKLEFQALMLLLRELDPNGLVVKDGIAQQQEQAIEASFQAVKALGEDTSKSLSVIQLDSQVVDNLIDQVAMMRIEFNRLNYALSTISQWVKPDQPGLAEWQTQLSQAQQSIEQALQKTQDASMQMRVVRLDYALRRFHSFVSQTAQQLTKKVRLEIVGGDTLIDKSMVNALAEPLAHLIRNAIDHGIEPAASRLNANKPEVGCIKLIAEQKQGCIYLTVSDDGAGLSAQAVYQRAVELGILKADTSYSEEHILQQIFFPGFSMADTVSQHSGRGVGMDVVKNSIVSMGGGITVNSKTGFGVDIQLKLPVSAVIQKTLLIRLNEQTYAIPENWVRQIMTYEHCKEQQVLYQGLLTPVYTLAALFKLEQNLDNSELLILQHENYQIALAVEKIIGRADVLLKQQQDYLSHIKGIAAASVLADGSIALLLDGLALFQLALGDQIHGLAAL